MKKIAILQSNYIPWKGYFDLIAAADEFIIYDDMQFTKNDWRNRNKIKTPNGSEWLSIPVGININRRIRDVSLPLNNWNIKHWKTLEANYSNAPFFNLIAQWLKPVYCELKFESLSEFNRYLIEHICNYLKITTKISWSWNYELYEGKTKKLIELCSQAGGTDYITGPSAKGYLDELDFKQEKIALHYFDYSNYEEYNQLWGSFDHYVSIIDLLFNKGPESQRYMKFFNQDLNALPRK